jgi:peroxiredoxin
MTAASYRSRRTVLSGIALAALLGAGAAQAAPAPAFSLKDAEGKTRTLSEFRGKTVVLEWTNEGCPYVKKHYSSGNMQALQKSATTDGVVWLTIISSAPGQQGYKTAEQAKAWKASANAASTAVLLDPTGTVGKAYGAKTTPDMRIIDKNGQLVFQGGIDDKVSTDAADVKTAKNYVRAALADIKAGKAVAVKAAKPYGCSIKYAE